MAQMACNKMKICKCFSVCLIAISKSLYVKHDGVINFNIFIQYP